jgi:hypothetical protein
MNATKPITESAGRESDAVITMNVQTELARVSRYGQQLEALLAPKKFEIACDRDTLLIGYWSLLLDFRRAILTLLPLELYGAAFALTRPVVEAWVRAHVVMMGSDVIVRQIKDDTYRVKFDRVGAEIDKAFGLSFFKKTLKKSVRDALHSYTHSGVFQIARRFDGDSIKPSYSEGAILNLLEASTTALIMATALVTKRFAFEDEWKVIMQMFHEYNTRPPHVPA